MNDAPALRQAEVGIAVSSATDVAKKSASAALTTEGLEGIVSLVKMGRTIYQRIITWILNKIVKTFQVVVFVILAFLLTGEYIVSISSMILFLFLTDFVTLSISTDNVRYSRKPDSWNISGLVRIAVLLGVLMVMESFLLLQVGVSYFELQGNLAQLHTFVFELLVLTSLFNVMIVRERKHFWESKPSTPLLLSVISNIIVVFLVSLLALPDMDPVSPVQSLTVLAYSLGTSFLINDPVKVLFLRRSGARL